MKNPPGEVTKTQAAMGLLGAFALHLVVTAATAAPVVALVCVLRR